MSNTLSAQNCEFIEKVIEENSKPIEFSVFDNDGYSHKTELRINFTEVDYDIDLEYGKSSTIKLFSQYISMSELPFYVVESIESCQIGININPENPNFTNCKLKISNMLINGNYAIVAIKREFEKFYDDGIYYLFLKCDENWIIQDSIRVQY